MPTYLNDYWPQIVQACKDRIEKDKTASITDVIEALKENKTIPGGLHGYDLSDLRIIEGYVLENPKYRSEFIEGRFIYLFKNQNYELSESVRKTNDSVNRTNIHSRVYGYGTMVFAAATFFVALFAYKKEPEITHEQLRKLLQKPSTALDKMQQSQKAIEESLQKAVKDSFYQKH